MHHQAIVRVACKVIRHDLAESLWEKTLVHMLYGAVHIFLGGGNPSPAVSFAIG